MLNEKNITNNNIVIVTMGTSPLQEYLYKFQDIFMEDGRGYKIILYKYPIVKKTECGCWIQKDTYSGKNRFVLNGTWKRFADPTIDKALDNFIRRKRDHSRILESQLGKAQWAFKQASQIKEENKLNDMAPNMEEIKK